MKRNKKFLTHSDPAKGKSFPVHKFVKKKLTEDKIEPSELEKKEVESKPADAALSLPEYIKSDDVAIKLKEIYENMDGTMPDMKIFEKRKHGRLIRAIITLIIACGFLATAVWVGLFVMRPSSGFTPDSLTLNLNLDNADIMASELITLNIRYHNTARVPLREAKLEVRYPDGFRFETSTQDPINDSKTIWELETLDAEEAGSIQITGRLYGDVPSLQSFRVFLNYTPDNFSSEFQKVATLNVPINTAPVAIYLTSAAEVVPGADTSFDIVVEPVVEKLGLIAVLIEPGELFTKKSANVDSDQNQSYRWTFSELAEQKDLTMTGVFVKSEGVEKQLIKVKVLMWPDSKPEGAGYLLAEATRDIAFLSANLDARLVINGSMNNLAVMPGEDLNTSLVIKNTGQLSLNHVEVRLLLETPAYQKKSILDWTKVKDEANGTIIGEVMDDTMRRLVFTWNEKQIKSLARLEPGQDVTIDLQIPIKGDEEVNLANFSAYTLRGIMEARYDLDGKKEIASSNAVALTLNSDLGLEVRDDINDSIHTITWLLTNRLHELKDIKVEADIFGDINWKSEALIVPAGKAEFNEKDKRLTWTIEAMPANVDVLALQFGVAFNQKNPSQTNLTSKVRIKAVDLVTGQEIIKLGDEVLLEKRSPE